MIKRLLSIAIFCLLILQVFGQQGTWSTTMLSEPRFRCGCAAAGDKLVFAGGGSELGYSNKVDIWNPNNTWTTATLSQARQVPAAAGLGTKAFFAGGYNGAPSNVVDIYNSATNSWSTATLSVARHSAAGASAGTKVFFAGGALASGYSNVVDIYDNSTNTWSTATLSVARTNLVGASVGTKVLFAGGSNGASVNTVDIYDLSTNTWTTATLSQARNDLAATTVGTKVIFAGGSAGGPSSAVVDIYDYTTNTWSTGTSLAGGARRELGGASIGNKAFFMGGYGPGISNAVDIYDAITNTWSSAALSVARYAGCAGTIGNKLFYAGGDPNASSAISQVDFYQISSVPIITAVLPASGTVGTTVTISGSNFSATPANNVVYFGAVKATVTASSTTSITTTVPAGATFEPLTVTVGGLTAEYYKPFNVTFSSAGTIAFDTKVDVTAGSFPDYTAIQDIDGDGKSDLLVSNGNSGNVGIHRNTTTGSTITFAAATTINTSTSPNHIAIADLDGDGKKDMVVPCATGNITSIFRNTSTPGAISMVTEASPGSNSPRYAALGDLDLDGKPDMVITNYNANNISVLKNTSSPGSITFGNALTYSTATNPYGVAIADIDGDGLLDIAVANQGTGSVSFFRNTTTAGVLSFGAKSDLTTPSSPHNIVLTDLDADGKPDLIVVNSGGNNTAYYKNIAASGAITASSFATKVDLPTGGSAIGGSAADLDGDGKPDLALVVNNTNSLALLRNTGSGTFATKVDLATNSSPGYSVSIGDFDNDGKLDLATPNTLSGNVSVYRNIASGSGGSSIPTITSFSPSSGIVGSGVTITGTNFSTTLANNTVYFGATKATVTNATPTQLTVSVPLGATYDYITVTVAGLTAYSSKPFGVTFGGSGIPASPFATAIPLATGVTVGVTLADFDLDGKSDIVASNYTSNTVSVFRNTSTSGSLSFAPKADLTAAGAFAAKAADIDGDGKLDLVVTNSTAGINAYVFRNTSTSGAISFAPKVDLTTGTNPTGIEIIDLDLDGKPDVAITNYTANSISLLRNTSTSGSVSFATKVDITTAPNCNDIAAADIDGDGKPDLAVMNNDKVSVFRNISTPGALSASSFATAVDFATNITPDGLRMGDLDMDGKPDMVVSSGYSNTLGIFRNTSTPGSITASSFAARVDLTTGSYPRHTLIGDLDGDGKPDLFAPNGSANTISIFRNISTSGTLNTASFAARVDITNGATDVFMLALGDLDGDGKPDLVASNYQNGNTISILRNTIVGSIPSPPTITSFTPAIGAVGASVTITGTNFSTTMTDNTVYFGGSKAAVTSASATQLIVTVPVGSLQKPISVTVNGLTGYSSKIFATTFPSTGTMTASSFAANVNFTAQANSYSLGAADFDLDGKVDIVVAPISATTVSLFQNTATSGVINTGSLATKIDFTIPGVGRVVSPADIDGDGKLDLVCSTPLGATIFRNVMSGPGVISASSFSSAVNISATHNGYRALVADVDLDGKPDLLFVNGSPTVVSVLRNTSSIGAISFATQIDFVTGTNPVDLAVADLDGDSKPEIIVANEGSSTVSVFRNTTTPGTINASSFDTKIDFNSAGNAWSLAIGDLNDDGKPEIISANQAAGSVSVFRNTTTSGVINASSFAAASNFTTGEALDLTLGDLNGDGKSDVIVANDVGGISVLINTTTTSTVSFAAKFAVGSNLRGALTGDIDGDGKPDLVGVGVSGVLSIFRNTMSTAPAPTITSFNPTSGVVGTSVTITGTNFSTTPANNIVKFNGADAIVSASTATSITTSVPLAATTGTITVTVAGQTATSATNFTVPAPTITSFNPTSGGPGTTVTITGTNFSASDNIVTFNGTTGTVSASTSTSITTTVPPGTTTGPITVTVGGQTATSSSNFTIVPPPTITNFNPTSGIVLTNITITGTNFSTTPANISVSFNGGTGVTPSASSLTSITVQVPVGATTGPITVTVNGQSATSSTNFTVLDGSSPVVTDKTATSVQQGSNLQILASVTDPESPVTSVSVEFRSITAGGSTTTQPMTLSAGDYSYTISASSIGELGVEYRILATSAGGTTTPAGFTTATVNFPAAANGIPIPYNSFGSTIAAYRIVAVPLELSSKTVSSVFDELGPYDPEKWRMYRYSNGTTTELTGSSQILPGQGYWLIVRNNPGNAINSGGGNSVNVKSSTPLQISLQAGWNQIGNPYNFNLLWSDVQAANPGLPGLRIFDGDFRDGTRLDKMQGGFVNVTSAGTLTFPVVKNNSVNGRVREDEKDTPNPLSEPNWQVMLNVQQGTMSNTISGIGMHEQASDQFDPLDGFNMPYFFETYLRLNHTKKEGDNLYSKDVVATADNHVWEFAIETTVPDRNITLAWDNSYFGENDKQLFLWDEKLQRSVDMRTNTSYTFDRNESKSFKIIFGTASYVREMVSVHELVLHHAWPNPAPGDVTISFTVPESSGAAPVGVSIVDVTGKTHWSYDSEFTSGYHEVTWKRTASPAGVYVVQVNTGSITKATRLILK